MHYKNKTLKNEKIGAVMVIGGGVSGMQASLDLANSGYYVYLVEKSSSIGGGMSQLDKTFPTNDCSMCILSPKLVEVGRHNNIELITLAEVTGIEGEEGNFQVQVKQKPRYIHMDKCIACGLCAQKCPKKVKDAYNEELGIRKAVYVKYPQAVPLKYAIDDENCLYFQKGKCRLCEKFCPNQAIYFQDQPKTLELTVGSIILAPGFECYDPSRYDAYAYADLPNVVTAMEFERLLSASGPFGGHLVRPSDEKEPKKIAWLQCVGSRDIHHCDHGYCSSVCCMYAMKEAVIAKEHSHEELDCTIFYMDIRSHGKDFERFYNKTERDGVRFIRSRIHSITPVMDSDDVSLTYVTEEGRIFTESFDLVVLSIGLEISQETIQLCKKLKTELDPYQFIRTDSFKPVATSRPGIYACGVISGPKDIPQSVMEASAAACAAATGLASARHTLTREKTTPKTRSVAGERPRVGVFICDCGINIAGVVRVPEVLAYAKTLPYVEYVEENLFTCSQDTQDKMKGMIRDHHLNRIVVAACTPRTHEPLFQETLTESGLNKYLFEMANIRNLNSWVHAGDPDGATKKAKDQVRMAIAKAAFLEPLQDTEVAVSQSGLVVGGGVAGMAAALELADQGYSVFLVEKSPNLGGNARYLNSTWRGEDIRKYLGQQIQRVQEHPKIKSYLSHRIKAVDGFVGNFATTLIIDGKDGEPVTLNHGVVIIATGAEEFRPREYLYTQNSRVLTHLDLDRLMAQQDLMVEKAQSLVFIQCVGSREPERPYCSRVCCTHSLHSALLLKKQNPERDIFVLYRDMRTYGEREELYKQAREAGIIFIRFSSKNKPVVEAEDDSLWVKVKDSILNQEIRIKADLVTLASAIVSTRDHDLAQMFKIPLNEDGFFFEAHVKLRPVDFATDGIFLCGLAHYPKPIDEAIAQAQAAVSRAVTLLSGLKIQVSGTVAQTHSALCSHCGTCLAICPYTAPAWNEKTDKAEINPALCKGCGLCVASCRSGAITLKGFNQEQILAMIDAV
jgi:heterodisulfide reductase subunit A2